MNFSLIVGYTVSAVASLFGVLVLVGVFFPHNVPTQFRVTFGIVLLLWGVYRFVVTRARAAEAARSERMGR